MSRIGIVSAMREELQEVLAQLPDEHVVSRAGRDFWVGHWQGHEVVVVLSGIGKVAAATTVTALVEHFGVKRLVFTGTAGGLGSGVQVGDVVVATSCVQHDMDASPLFPRFEVPLYDQANFLADPALSTALMDAARAVLADLPGHIGADTVASFHLKQPRVHHGMVASGDQFIATAAASKALHAVLPEVLAVEMEGGALAQVCHDYRLPWALVRTVSDRADDQAHVDFNRFVGQVASRYSSAILAKLLASL